MIAIHAQKPQIGIFQFFWRELELIGARVYRPEDYTTAMALLAKAWWIMMLLSLTFRV